MDSHRRTQVGRALHRVGSADRSRPTRRRHADARERNFSTWAGPLCRRSCGCANWERWRLADRFLREEYIAEFNRRFQIAPRQRGNAFVPCRSRDLERIFSLQFERTVQRDNTLRLQNLTLQIEPVKWRGTLAGCSVTAHQHLDGTLSLRYGPHALGRYDATGAPPKTSASRPLSRGRGTAPVPCNPIPKTNPTQTARAQF